MNNPRRQVAQRILSLKQGDETDSAFARRLGLTPQLVSNYRSGRHGASLDAVIEVVRHTEVNPRWLLTGEGRRDGAGGEEGEEVVPRILGEVIDSVDGLMEELEAKFDLSPGPRRGPERPAGEG